MGIISLVTPIPPVLETEGMVQVCAVIENATLERDVLAVIRTIQSTASGKYNIPMETVYIICNCVLCCFTDPDDYSGGMFSIIFQSPNTTACIYIDIEKDDIFEEDEVFFVSLIDADPATVPGSITTATITILDETGVYKNSSM